jgi:hypothetical protein
MHIYDATANMSEDALVSVRTWPRPLLGTVTVLPTTRYDTYILTCYSNELQLTFYLDTTSDL